jgi:hypothetical protein
LKNNETLEQFRSERPSVATRDYWKYLTEKICIGTGMPYVVVFPESMQGTVYRGSLDAAASWFAARSQVMIEALRRIYEYYMRWAVFGGDPALRNKPGNWYAVSIRPPRTINVDVGRNSSAMLAELAAGATNYERIYAPLGLDWREEILKLKEQRDFIRQELGQDFILPGDKQPQPQAVPTE